MPKGLFLLNTEAYHTIYGPPEREAIGELVDLYAPPQTRASIEANPDVLVEAEIIFSGWGMPKLDKAFLDLTSNLRAVFYGAGSIKGIVTDAFWARNIPITSSYSANGVPAAEFALSQILFSLKRGWYFVTEVKAQKRYPERTPVPGAFGSTVGLISLGMVGRLVREYLRAFAVKVIACDPFVSPEEAAKLDVELCALEEVFQRADVVSLHTPWLKETEGLITGAHLTSMKPDATFINTARGAVVRENEMIDVLKKRTDLFAVLDVTYPEPPVAGSPLYTLPNVILTPHIAGPRNAECRRMGQLVLSELKRFLNGEPLQTQISEARAKTLA